MLTVRTDFSSAASWERLREALATPNADGFLPVVDPLDDPRFTGLSCDEALNRLPHDYQHPLLALADKVTLSSFELPLAVVDLWERPGRSIRVVAAELWSIENNLSIANMDFDEFARSVDEDGVFRGH